MAESLLLVEDEPLLGSELVRHYRRTGWEVVHARNLAEAQRALTVQHLEPLVVLADMSLPDGNSLDLLEKTQDHSVSGEWVFLTAYGGVADSVRALRLGAYDFLEKPCDLARLDLVVNSAARSARAQRRLREQTAERNQRYSIATFFGRSPAAQGLREMVAKLTRVPFSALLLTGETGTGKGLVARIVHYGGARQEAPLVEVNCAALPRDLLESELFGFEPGAFTGAKGRHRGLMEQAQGGTLFLDEVSELGVDLQAKLLKAIEDRRFRRLAGSIEIDIDVQLVAATNRDLQECIQAGLFRADLYHRLSVFSLELPPLRVRKEDLEDLVPLFVAEFNAKAGKAVRIIPEQIWDKLRAYDWPGNVRELRNVVERCVLLSENEVFPLQWLQLHAAEPSSSPLAHPQGEGLWLPFDGSITLDDMDCYIIKIALERAHFNVTAAARLLGTTRQTLRYRIQKYGLKSSG